MERSCAGGRSLALHDRAIIAHPPRAIVAVIASLRAKVQRGDPDQDERASRQLRPGEGLTEHHEGDEPGDDGLERRRDVRVGGADPPERRQVEGTRSILATMLWEPHEAAAAAASA